MCKYQVQSNMCKIRRILFAGTLVPTITANLLNRDMLGNAIIVDSYNPCSKLSKNHLFPNQQSGPLRAFNNDFNAGFGS